MVVWFATGRKVDWVKHPIMTKYIIYLSNVASTNVQPVFIVGAALMGIFFVWTNWEEWHLRSPSVGYLMPRYSKFVCVLHWANIIFSFIASVAIVLVSCFKVSIWSNVHIPSLDTFCVALFIYVVSTVVTSFCYYRHYKQRQFLISGILKIIWAIAAIVLIFCFGYFQTVAGNHGDDSPWWGYSGICEWSVCYWYGILFFILSADLRGPRPDASELPPASDASF